MEAGALWALLFAVESRMIPGFMQECTVASFAELGEMEGCGMGRRQN